MTANILWDFSEVYYLNKKYIQYVVKEIGGDKYILVMREGCIRVSKKQLDSILHKRKQYTQKKIIGVLRR